ncbi:MAG: 23S rRNA (adenine(2503)-C(2))-methyltransferase RlmN [Phycisphaerales bacterium]|nr:23S rRNA (adenine(2503)-C(2))-methyltransferase RlmN [Phycisphaerales bacterium]
MIAAESDIPLNPLSMTGEEFAQRWKQSGIPGGRPRALEAYAAFYREGVLIPELKCTIEELGIGAVVRTHTSESNEGTVLKFTQRVPKALPTAKSQAAASHDRQPGTPTSVSLPVQGGSAGEDATVETESVVIPMVGRKRELSYTICVSSQVGCAMGCVFCQTAQMGLLRHLKPQEIVAQWWAARHAVQRPDASAPIDNIVFMGMGEPLDNFDNVMKAIEILTDRRGPAIAMRRITISTVGRVDGIERLMEQVQKPGWHQLGLAVSLNAPSDAVRSGIMPVNRAWNMGELRKRLCTWGSASRAHLCLEYVLIPGVNDGPQHAAELAAYVHGEEFENRRALFGEGEEPGFDDAQVARYPGASLRGLVNLIPYNPREQSPWRAPTDEEAEQFMQWLRGLGVYCKRRRTKGRDQMAACGQLGNLAYRRASKKPLTK